jgi:uncharacterized phage-associated protein
MAICYNRKHVEAFMYLEKTIQLMHFFAEKNGGTISDVKLMKLMYFTDRLSISDTGYPLTYDDYFSMKRGPVLSGAKHLIDSYTNSQFKGLFKPAVDAKSPNNFSLKNVTLKNIGSDVLDLENENFDLLSVEDRKTADEIFSKMGSMTDDEIALNSHRPHVCPEWQKPEVGRLPISIESILDKLGYSTEELQSHATDIKYYKNVVFK